MKPQQKVELDAKYSNWNGWYMDTFEQIRGIRNIGGNLLLDPKENIHRYYSAILNIYSTHSSYITTPKEIKKRLDKVEGKIYSEKFHEQLEKQMISVDIINTIKEMVNIFTHMNHSFSRHGITPKINTKLKEDPGDAMIKVEY